MCDWWSSPQACNFAASPRCEAPADLPLSQTQFTSERWRTSLVCDDRPLSLEDRLYGQWSATLWRTACNSAAFASPIYSQQRRAMIASPATQTHDVGLEWLQSGAEAAHWSHTLSVPGSTPDPDTFACSLVTILHAVALLSSLNMPICCAQSDIVSNHLFSPQMTTHDVVSNTSVNDSTSVRSTAHSTQSQVHRLSCQLTYGDTHVQTATSWPIEDNRPTTASMFDYK